MIEINLLPPEMRKKESKFKSIELGEFDIKNLPIANIAITTGVVILLVHSLLFLVGIYSKSNTAKLSKQYNSMISQKNEAVNLKAQIDLINKKVSAIDELMVKRFSWAKKLNDLSDSVTPGIWLSSFEYDEKLGERSTQLIAKNGNGNGKAPVLKPSTEKVMIRYLIISGYASSMGEQGTALIGKFIQSLKDNAGFYSDFNDIELGSIKSERIQDQEVMSFKLTCMFKRAE